MMYKNEINTQKIGKKLSCIQQNMHHNFGGNRYNRLYIQHNQFMTSIYNILKHFLEYKYALTKLSALMENKCLKLLHENMKKR